MKKKIIRITTVPMSLAGLLKGQLKFMGNHFNVIGIASNGEGLLKEIEASENITTMEVEMTRKITPLRDLIAVYKLYKIFKKEQPFIVHSHTPKAGTLGMFAAKLAGVPNRLHTIAGLPLLEATGNKRKLLNGVEKLTYACATKIYPNSYGLKTIILENKFTHEEKLKVIGNGSSNGINTNYFNPSLYSENEKNELKQEWGITQEDFVFVFVGRLVADKGINELINAFDETNKKFPKTKLLLVGTFEDQLDPLDKETLYHIETNKNIINPGWIQDVRPYFAISNCLVFPSYREGFPNVVLQAGAMKLPCIVSNINGCNEIISEPENGIIIPVKNTEVLIDAMNTMYTMPKEKQQQMGDASRARIVSRFEQQFVWEAILKEYQTLENI